MSFRLAHKTLFQPIAGIMGFFCLLSLFFIGTYLYVDYQRYISSYKITQQAELKAAQEKINTNVDNIKKLSVLTAKRIAASNGNIKRIQHILVSSYVLLPDRDFLKIQKVAYEKHSLPQHLITRFGISPLNADRPSINKTQGEGSSIFFNQNSVYSKAWVFNQNNQLDGILEIHVPMAHFKETLKLGSTLSFASDSAHVPLQKNPFPIYGKLPSFWGYFIENIGHFALFFLFVMLTAPFIAISTLYARFRIKQNFQEDMESLTNELSELRKESYQANESLLTAQKQTATHQATCQSYKVFQSNFQNRQRVQLHHVLRSLDVVMRSLQDPDRALPPQDLVNILKSCLPVVERTVNGTVFMEIHEPVNIFKILENIRSLFTEKMYKSDLTLEVDCPNNLTYWGDSLGIEFVLLNLIGKSLHRAPKNGKVDIKVIEHNEGFSIDVKGNGFPVSEKSKRQIQQAFDFFMSDASFQQLCQENGLFYEYVEERGGSHMAKIFFSRKRADSLESNVISLFNKGYR